MKKTIDKLKLKQRYTSLFSKNKDIPAGEPSKPVKESAKYDLTTGPILSKLLLVAIPVMGTQLMQMSYNLVDMLWVGRLGSDAISASGAAGLYMWLSVAFMLIGSVGAGIGVSQSIGRGDKEACQDYAQTALWINIALGIAFMLAMIVFCKQMVAFFNFSEDSVVQYAETYLSIAALSIPLTYITAVLSGTFNALGRTRIAFRCNACGIILNMVLDPILIFVFNLGIAGAAIATAFSQAFVCVLIIIAIKYNKNKPFPQFRIFKLPSIEKAKQIVKWTVPICLESLFFTFLVMVTSRLEASFGSDAMAMSRVGSQLESLTWMIGGGFGAAFTTFVGQNFGAEQQSRIKHGVRLSAGAMALYGLFVTVILAVFGKYLFALFLPDPILVQRSVLYLRILSICQIPMCLEAVSSGAFKGSGRTVPPSVVSTVSNILRVPLTYLLSYTSLGLIGVWLGITISSVIKGLWSLSWYLLAEKKAEKKQNKLDIPASACD